MSDTASIVSLVKNVSSGERKVQREYMLTIYVGYIVNLPPTGLLFSVIKKN